MKINHNIFKAMIILLLLVFFFPVGPWTEEGESHFLEVTYWGQTMEWPWGGDFQGDSNVLIAYNGCTIVSSAMVLKYYGVDMNPRELNLFLVENDGFADGSYKGEALGKINIRIERFSKLFPQVSGTKYVSWQNTRADIELIKSEIRKGHPVIAQVLYQKMYGHSVVVYGFEGDILYIHDPIEKAFKTINDSYNAFDDSSGTGPSRNIVGAIFIYGTEQ